VNTRAVFDTNVVVSTLVFGRRLLWLRRAWANGSVIPIVCRETVTELLRVLTYPKFRLDTNERDLLLADYLPFAEVVSLPNPLPDLPITCRDRDDAIFLHLAISSRADLLVSGDKDMTVLSLAYPVVSPAQFHDRLKREE
jgi:putative PIN family toxin of toxin-antitoxin system